MITVSVYILWLISHTEIYPYCILSHVFPVRITNSLSEWAAVIYRLLGWELIGNDRHHNAGNIQVKGTIHDSPVAPFTNMV